MRVSLTVGLASLASPALGWGMFGHQITATIAQIYLLPSTRKAICDILPGTYKCNLAGVASWPAEIKQDSSYGFYAGLHFVNVDGDVPPRNCVFNASGLKNDHHILKGIVDQARDVIATEKSPISRDHALRFLVHFLGDIHQPLHLTGYQTGANAFKVTWGDKVNNTNFHSVWDDWLIDRQVLFVNTTEYTSVLPTNSSTRNTRIETTLKGLNYDPFIRYILLEGVYKRWAEDVEEWISCPQTNQMNLEAQSILGDGTHRFQDPSDLPTVCPLHWATQTHPLLCGSESIWPDEALHQDLSKGYAANVRDRMIVEKQLAMGGIRLASVLNGLFGSAKDKAVYGLVPLFA